MENTAELGTIAGRVDGSFIPALSRYDGVTVETGCAVYVFERGDAIDDHHENSTVITSARVRFSETAGEYGYAAGALPGGTVAQPALYTLALTCDADNPLADNPSPTDPTEVRFTPARDASLVLGEISRVDFLAP